jgi:RNA polymerase sigma factor (sigma-70 family)
MHKITKDDIKWAEIIARRTLCKYPVIHKEEAVSSAYEGLVVAARNYDKHKSDWFLYAFYQIRQHITYEMRRWTGDRRLKKGKEFRNAIHSSLDEFEPSSNGTEKKIVNKELIHKILNGLTGRERTVLEEVYCNGFTLAETAKKLNTSQSRICVDRKRALRKARKRAILLEEQVCQYGKYNIDGNLRRAAFTDSA